MLRHKAMIQAARYAFGFSGIYDEDEGSKIAEMRDVTPPSPPQPPKPPAPPSAPVEAETQITLDGEIIDHVAEGIDADHPEDGEEFDANAFFEALEADLAQASTVEDVEEAWTARDAMSVFDGDEQNQAIALAIKKRRLKAIGG